jgi:hypothetical protein
MKIAINLTRGVLALSGEQLVLAFLNLSRKGNQFFPIQKTFEERVKGNYILVRNLAKSGRMVSFKKR